MNRASQNPVMARFDARVAAVMGDAVVVKRGMALERRLDCARTRGAKLRRNEPRQRSKQKGQVFVTWPEKLSISQGSSLH